MEKNCCKSCIADILDAFEYIDFVDDIPSELEEITNIYRTKEYIVCQTVCMRGCGDNENVLVSTDTYYRRTVARDEQYEVLFCDRRHIDGKRMAASMYTRKYID